MLIDSFYLILLFSFWKLISCQITFDKEYPGIKICQSGNIQDLTLHNPVTRKKDIDNLIANNCTHLQGSLYIRGLRDMRGESIFFDSIREIDGHLIIETNDLETISLKNLVVIRGHVSKTHTLINKNESVNISLQVTGNVYLKNLILTNLRSIHNHDVLFDNNPLLHYIPHKIKWNELFSKPSIQRVHSFISTQDMLSQDLCHSSCNVWPNNNSSFCWGPLPNQCQIKTLCETLAGECETCIYKDGKEINCCDHLCLGGCRKFGPENCIACKQMLNGKRCVEACPSRFKGGIAGLMQNQAFKYYSGSFCSTKCPENMLPEDSVCVHSCSIGYYKNKTNHCVKCYDDICKKEDIPCDMMEMISKDERDFALSAKILVQLTNCTKLRGYLSITEHTFKKNNVTVKMLYDHLSNVEDLEGGFTYFMDDHLTNLTFLAKLKTFREANLHVYMTGTASYNKFLISATQLEFLGLKSLKKIIGKIYIGENKKLCYVDLPWKEIVDGKFKIVPQKCPNEKCDKECSDKGCWNSGNKWCYECRAFDAGGQCVSNCSSAKGYFLLNSDNTTNGTCNKCHKECNLTCNGTSAKDCIGGCVNKEENGVCVSNCSFASFEEKKTNKCLKCSEDCTNVEGLPQCSGPSNIPGKGGCNKCRHLLINRSSGSEKIVNCVSQCPPKTFARVSTNKAITQYFPNIGYVCEPCHSLCSKCSGRRQHREDCITCDGFWNRDDCLPMCPEKLTYGYNSSRYCLRCSNACLGGCSGPTAYKCNKCREKKVPINETMFHCQKTCPTNKNIEEMDLKTREIVCFALYESAAKKEEIKRTKIIIVAVIIMLFIVIIVIVAIVICLRRKANLDRIEAELKACYSNLTEPNSKDENAFSQPPNMGRLVIISIEDLIFEDQSRPLGFGAFGYVYKGKWKIPKEEDMLIKKSTGDFYLPVAIKVIKTIGPSENDAIMQEAKIMASVSHMHCLRFIGVCLSYEKPCLVTAYVKEGSLDKYLVRNRSKITSLIMLSWAEQIADGMFYLTKRGIIHRDLAARNVLVSRLECVQITDFGLSKMLQKTNEKEIVIKSGKVPIRWLAIETLQEGKYSFETDVWAYGVTLWEIFTFGKVPYEDQATLDISDFVLKGGRLSQPDICSLDVYIVMVNCWLESPNLRPDFESLMRTFVDYCKNPGRYLSIQGDPFEIPSPSNIEMTNFTNPYNDQFNFYAGTAETTLPLLNSRDSVDRGHSIDSSLDRNSSLQGDDESRNLLSLADQQDLPTRTANKTNNLFKRFYDKNQPINTQPNINSNSNNPSRLVPLASVEEPAFRASSIDEDPRYVADPTDNAVKLRTNPYNLKTQLSQTPRFQNTLSLKNSELSYNLPPPPKTPNLNVDNDGYLDPINSPKISHFSDTSNDTDGYLEPVSMKKSLSIEDDEYMTPSYNNTPRETSIKTDNNKQTISANESKKLPPMMEESNSSNHYFPETPADDEYLEPIPTSSLLKSRLA